MAKKGIHYFEGKVVRIFDPYFLENRTDWLKNGAPKGTGLIVDEDVDVQVNDYVDDKGKIDTLGRYKEPKYDEITNTRFTTETGGIEINGIKVDTSRESQALITGAALQAVVDPEYTCNWKTETGFMALDHDTILGVAMAVRAHVQKCFNTEAILLEKVKKATSEEEISNLRWDSVTDEEVAAYSASH